jgi:WD40 repeat protein
MDKTLKLWDVDSGLELFTLSGHTAEVSAVTMTADGKRAVSASWDDTLRVWDLESGKLLNTLLGHSRFVTSVAMTADGKRVVSGADDNTVKVWDLEYPRTGATVRAHCYWVDRVAMSRNGRRAVSSSAFEKSLQVWDAERGEPLLVLRGHTRSVTCVAISADGNRIVSGSKDGLKVWNGEDGSEMHTLTSDEVSAVALSGNGSRVISGGLGSVRVWDVEEGAELFNLRHPAALNMFRNEVRIVALDDEGLRAVSIGEYMKIWDLRTGSEIREVPIGGHADGGAISADGQLAISAAWDERTIRLFDVDGRSELCRLAGHREQVREVCPSLDWRRAVSVSDDHKAILWNLKTGELIATFTADAGLRCCSMTSEGHIVVGDELGTVHFLRLEDRL